LGVAANGFPALGLAFALSDWPEDHPARKDLLAEFQKHMAALKPHQDARTGCWHQVIDHPESYDEYSCTCMIGTAMQRGIRRGWLAKEEYRSCVDRAWRAILERTEPDGKLVNVCASTGKQKTLQDYFEPPRHQRPRRPGRRDGAGPLGRNSWHHPGGRGLRQRRGPDRGPQGGPVSARSKGSNPHATGDGHRLAAAAGGELVNMDVTLRSGAPGSLPPPGFAVPATPAQRRAGRPGHGGGRSASGCGLR